VTREPLSLFDTSLRDGLQTQGVQFSTTEKLTIVTELLPATQAPRAKKGSINIWLMTEVNPLKSFTSNPVPRWDTP
jgi:hypothetical protein